MIINHLFITLHPLSFYLPPFIISHLSYILYTLSFRCSQLQNQQREQVLHIRFLVCRHEETTFCVCRRGGPTCKSQGSRHPEKKFVLPEEIILCYLKKHNPHLSGKSENWAGSIVVSSGWNPCQSITQHDLNWNMNQKTNMCKQKQVVGICALVL